MSFLTEVEHLQIPLQDIYLATSNFSEKNFIASGGFGKVYQGQSDKLGMVAIKRLDRKHGQGEREFMMEIALLSTYKHENIVSLVGFSNKDGEKILVYKHERNGSLDKYLHRKDLTWIQRLQICIDAARGLKYLHHDVGLQHRIIHRDIKSSNILLDENWRAKISDFGLSKVGPANVQHTFLISQACGTIGYIDPEYLDTGVLTKESDVYSFGVVLFEVLCGRPARVMDERQYLNTLAQIHYEKETLVELIPSDFLKQINTASLSTFSTIAYKCLMKHRQDRPTMTLVVEELEEALNYQLASSGSGPIVHNFVEHREKNNLTHSDMPVQQARLPASSFSHSTSASSKSWGHNVFLSFGGEDDICMSFMDHLRSALVQNGIETYMRGMHVSPSFMKAIQESQIALIVFSKNCISCRFLDEVACIMKCMEERGQVVKAIFYGVDSLLQMREEIQNYGEAISKLELINDRKVGSWRNAMMNASNLSGWVPKYFANGNDLKCINQIVDTVSLGLLPLMSSSPKTLIGIETRMLNLKSLLEIGAGDVRMIGIWGIGGGGKSTLAFSIYMEICHEFDRWCFIENIREEASRHGLNKLQQKILTDVLKPKQIVVSSIEEGKSMIKSRLCGISVLMVLNDVDHIDQLKALAGSNGWFGKGSRIIITTRNEDLLNAHEVNGTYRVSLLNDNEANELFIRHAFGKNRHVNGYEDFSQNVVSKVGGVPFAAKSLGSFLCNKDINEWSGTLATCVPYIEILENLKISYDGLELEEKELFLEITCLIDANLGHLATMILDACGFDSIKRVNVLIQKALITISNGVIIMHDLVKEMGLYIVRREHLNSLEHSGVWQKEEFLSICSTDATEHLPMLKLLSLDKSKFLIRTPDFSGLPCLERITFRECENLEEIHPSVGYLEKLVFLDLYACLKLQMFPPIVRMIKLETLILHGCYNLSKVPDIQIKLDTLVKLSLSSTAIKVVPSSIGKYCTNLVSLDLGYCRNLKSIEGNFRSLKSLKELHLAYCKRLGKLPMDLYDEDCCLEALSLSSHESISITSVMGGIMSRFSYLDYVSSKFPHFPRFLKKLELRNCDLVDEDIISDFCQLSNLQELDLCGNKFNGVRPIDLSQLPCLKFIDLSYCRKLRKLPLLPSSIAFLKANSCDAIELIENLPTNYKWLWKVSLYRTGINKLSGCERVVLRSMIQGNAIQDHFMSLRLQHSWSNSEKAVRWKPLKLQLPRNWYNDFSGFLICINKVVDSNDTIRIIIKQDTGMDSQCIDEWEKFENTFESDVYYAMVGYVSFGALRRTSWWNSAHTRISFFLETAKFKVALVPRKCKGGIKERAVGVTDCSEFWDEVVEGKGGKTFEIQHDSRSSIEILWSH